MASKCNDIWGSKEGGGLKWTGHQKHTKMHKKHSAPKRSEKDMWGFNPDLGTMKGWYGTWAGSKKCETEFHFY